MIERQTIDGRGALVAYMNDKMEPADKKNAALIKVIFDDGDLIFLVPSETPRPTFNPNHDPHTGEFTSGGGFDATTAEKFIEARNKSTRAGFLSPLKPEDLTDRSLFINKDGTVGFALTKEGDLENLFNNGGPKGAGAKAVLFAISQGAKTLDCFDGFLPSFYKKFGFKEYKRVKFDRQFAPKTWDYTRHGEPDIVYMRLT